MGIFQWHNTKMTSNNTPSPLVAKASSEYDANYQAWKAFDGSVAAYTNSWITLSKTLAGWIQLYFGSKTNVNKFKITSHDRNVDSAPKRFQLLGSNDEENFDILGEFNNETNWGVSETREFDVSNTSYYTNYRINVLENNGYADYLAIGEIVFGGIIPEKPKLVVKNPTTNEHYSLSDNTLIHMPDSSNKNMILHGIEQGKEIQLDVPFDKHRYFNDTPVANTSGKVFTHDIGKINALNIKEIRESKSIVTTWYYTNMTSDTTPAPLVAKSSGIFNTTYPAWKAFNGTTANADDGWVSSNKTGWIEIYFGKKILINILNLSHRNTTTLTSAPKSFAIEGSNDGVAYETIVNISNEINWSSSETRQFVFNNTKEYSYYRINVSENNGHVTELSIGEIQFGLREVK